MAAIDLELPNVIVCEEELPDGTWRSVVSAVQIRPAPPPVIVLSYREDERLWAEVLRRGGFDVLACPLDPSRTRLAIDYAALRSHSESSPPGVMRMAAQGY